MVVVVSERVSDVDIEDVLSRVPLRGAGGIMCQARRLRPSGVRGSAQACFLALGATSPSRAISAQTKALSSDNKVEAVMTTL